MSGTDFLFANGRIKALEGKLLDRAKWNQLYDADATEAQNILADSGYGADATNPQDVEDLIDTELTAARELINEITPDPILTDLFLLETDGHNIKTLLKGKIQGVDVDETLTGGGSIPVEELKRAVESERYGLLPIDFEEALKKLDRETDPRIVSAVVDNAVYTHIKRVLKKHKDPLLAEYFTAKIDFTNLLTIIRSNVLGWEISKVRPLLLDGGEFSQSMLLDAVGLPPESLVKQLATGKHSLLIKSVLESYLSHKSVTEVEQRLDEAAYNVIHEARNDAFGIGPMANYLMQKLTEAKALRVMFTAKRAGVNIPLSELGIG